MLYIQNYLTTMQKLYMIKLVGIMNNIVHRRRVMIDMMIIVRQEMIEIVMMIEIVAVEIEIDIIDRVHENGEVEIEIATGIEIVEHLVKTHVIHHLVAMIIMAVVAIIIIINAEVATHAAVAATQTIGKTREIIITTNVVAFKKEAIMGEVAIIIIIISRMMDGVADFMDNKEMITTVVVVVAVIAVEEISEVAINLIIEDRITTINEAIVADIVQISIINNAAGSLMIMTIILNVKEVVAICKITIITLTKIDKDLEVE